MKLLLALAVVAALDAAAYPTTPPTVTPAAGQRCILTEFAQRGDSTYYELRCARTHDAPNADQ